MMSQAILPVERNKALVRLTLRVVQQLGAGHEVPEAMRDLCTGRAQAKIVIQI